MALQIRAATTEDADALVRVINAAFVVERFFIDRDRTTREAVRALCTTGGFLVGVDLAGQIVACVYRERRGDHGYFGLLSVVPECRLRGYGRQLIDAVEADFRTAGCSAMDIRVVNLRTELPLIYRRLGYVETGTQRFDDLRASQPCHFILMSKSL